MQKEADTKPYHAKPYPVPHSQEKQLKDEVEQLINYGVLRKENRSEWDAPCSLWLNRMVLYDLWLT